MHDQPGLFNVALPETPVRVPARSGRGRTRETYARTVVADVTVLDRRALRTAALRTFDGGVVVIGECVEPEDEDLPDPREEIATRVAAAVEWCLEPTLGMWPLLESGAVRIDAIDLAVEERAAALVRASWTVRVKIQDAPAARECALAACPVADVQARAEIEQCFATVWHWAAEPYAPTAGIPGVTWTPVDVTVVQVMSRSR